MPATHSADEQKQQSMMVTKADSGASLSQPLSKLCSNLLCLGFFTPKMEIIIVPPHRGVVRIKSIHVKPLQ